MDENKENGTFVKIKNNFFDEFTPKELTALMLITIHDSNFRSQYIFTIDNIIKLMNTANTKREQKIIKDLLTKLKQNDYAKFYTSPFQDDKYIINNFESIKKDDFIYMIYSEDVNLEDEFILIYDEEIHKILTYDKEAINRYSLLEIFTYLIKHISNNALAEDYLLCYPSYKLMHEQLGLSENTISKYIEVLQDINLIRCDYVGIEQLANGAVKNTKMYYCRTRDEKALIERIEYERNSKGFIKLNKKAKDKINLKRSITQRINYLENKLKQNTITETETITLKELKAKYIEL